MNTQVNSSSSKPSSGKFFYFFITGILLIGLILSILSWLHICTEACAEGHNYRLYGFTFESLGIPFFIALIGIHLFSRKYTRLKWLVGFSLSVAVGAEVMFIYAQKAIIGHWCPLCLGIAASIMSAFTCMAYQYGNELKNLLNKGQKEKTMKNLLKGLFCIFLAFSGFIFSQAGFAKYNQLHAAENSIKNNIAFGDLTSSVEVYIFTDWECPSCRKVEPVIERAFPKITKQARVIFVDLPVHPESMNFTPYNLSFMIKNKEQYFKLRDALSELSSSTTSPTDDQVEALAKKQGLVYHQLSYSDIAVGTKYFQHLAKQFGVDRTPTVIIVNKDIKKGKKLIGGGEITEDNLIKAIESLAKKS